MPGRPRAIAKGSPVRYSETAERERERIARTSIQKASDELLRLLRLHHPERDPACDDA